MGPESSDIQKTCFSKETQGLANRFRLQFVYTDLGNRRVSLLRRRGLVFGKERKKQVRKKLLRSGWELVGGEGLFSLAFIIPLVQRLLQTRILKEREVHIDKGKLLLNEVRMHYHSASVTHLDRKDDQEWTSTGREAPSPSILPYSCSVGRETSHLTWQLGQ